MPFFTAPPLRFVDSSISSSQVSDDLAALMESIYRGGIDEALRFLNRRVPHRYTGIYKFQGDMVRNVFLYDKQDKISASLFSAPRGDSFCQHIAPDMPFFTSNSAIDSRLEGNKSRSLVTSYYGVALSRVPGVVLGSFCHFDSDKQVMPAGEAVFLDQATRLLLDRLNGFDR